MIKQPCAKDREILSYLKQGNVLSGAKIQNLFSSIDHRDAIYRLRKAGHSISSERVSYIDSDGKYRWYMNYSIKAA